MHFAIGSLAQQLKSALQQYIRRCDSVEGMHVCFPINSCVTVVSVQALHPNWRRAQRRPTGAKNSTAPASRVDSLSYLQLVLQFTGLHRAL